MTQWTIPRLAAPAKVKVLGQRNVKCCGHAINLAGAVPLVLSTPYGLPVRLPHCSSPRSLPDEELGQVACIGKLDGHAPSFVVVARLRGYLLDFALPIVSPDSVSSMASDADPGPLPHGEW